MADVQVNQTSDRGSAGWVWAIVILVLVALVAWFLFAGGFGGDDVDAEVDINVPAAEGGAPAPTTP